MLKAIALTSLLVLATSMPVLAGDGQTGSGGAIDKGHDQGGGHGGVATGGYSGNEGVKPLKGGEVGAGLAPDAQ